MKTTPDCWEYARGVLVALLAFSWFAQAGIAAGQNLPDKRPPNLIVLMADDLSARELGCYGHPRHRTPHLDRLARTGTQFETCFATPLCHPTRFEIMTGQYGHHNRVYNFPGRRGGPQPGSPEDNIANHLTFAQVLKPRGYATAQAGKWQLTGEHPTLIYECGFDEYCMWAYKHNLPPGVEHTGGWEGAKQGKTSRYWHPSIVRNGKYLPTGPDDYGPDVFTDFVIDFARRHRDRRFFIYYPMCLTHGPHCPTPDTVKSEAEKYKHSRDNFQADVEYTDKLVGRIVQALEELRLRDNTVIFFTADNGTGGRGKGQPTELGARVPMIVNGPGVVQPTGLSKQLVDLSDVLPTLTELAGAELPSDHPIDGRSFAPALRGRPGGLREWIYSYLGDRRIVRTNRWLLEDNSPVHPGRLYDCGTSRDGTNYRDVTGSHDAEVLSARKMMESILADKPVPHVSYEGPAAAPKRKTKRPARNQPEKPKARGRPAAYGKPSVSNTSTACSIAVCFPAGRFFALGSSKSYSQVSSCSEIRGFPASRAAARSKTASWAVATAPPASDPVAGAGSAVSSVVTGGDG